MKGRRSFSNKPIYKRRRRIALLVLLALVVIPISAPARNVVIGLISRDDVAIQRITPPLYSLPPTTLTGNGIGQKEKHPPKDHTLYLTIPKLGLYERTVKNDYSDSALDQGAVKLPSSGFPWQKHANTYIAGHRVGYRDTQSYYEFLDLPSLKKGDEIFLKDANGVQYAYQVTKVFVVKPQDSWVTKPVPGKDMVTLQTCTETLKDWWTIGPNLMESSPDTGRLIVRAERTN